MSRNYSVRLFITVAVFSTLLLSYNFISAWTAAPSNPPADNVAAPLNVSNVTQTKNGVLNATTLYGTAGGVLNNLSLGVCVHGGCGVWGYETIQLPFNNNLRINFGGSERFVLANTGVLSLTGTSQVNAERYCDQSGTNCFNGSDFKPLPSCADGKILIAQAGGWVCGDPGYAPAPTAWLVYSQHSEAQCTSLSGTVVTEGGQKFCRFNAASCPGGWAQNQNWSTRAGYTTGNVCPALTSGQTCTFSGMAWSNSSKNETRTVFCDGTGDNDNVWTSCSASLSQVGCY